MLKRVRRIRGVGLFRDADASPLELRPLTLVFGENAAGKSTLSAVLRSLSNGDATILSERRTFRFTEEQKVDILDEHGSSFTFENGSWSKSNPEVLVFDASFVDSNVYSGITIESSHRKSLLDFAIGSEAVAEKRAEARDADLAKKKREEVRDIEQKVDPFRKGMPLADFLKLPLFEDPEAEIEELEGQLDQAKRVQTLKTRKRPARVSKPDIGLAEIENVLRTSLDGAHEEAAERVRERIERMHRHRAEDWLATGLELVDDAKCPFCGQSIDANQIIADYRSYFNEAYKRITSDVARLPKLIESLTRAANADVLLKDIMAAQAVLDPWTEDIELAELPLAADKIRAACGDLASSLEDLSREKTEKPTVALGDDGFAAPRESIRAIDSAIDEVNGVIVTAQSRINEFLAGLESLDEMSIKEGIRRRRLSQIRHSTDVKELESRLDLARDAERDAEVRKDQSRERARLHVNGLLEAYCDEINRLLAKFNASFAVEKINHDYKARGEPAVRYALSVRREVLDTSQSERLLRSVLSDGDKRTLAFAFFLAALRSRGSLATKVLVLDDPVTSLDANRRRATIEIIDELRSQAQQVIVLAHDENFLLNVRDWISHRDRAVSACEIKVHQVGEDAVTLARMSLDEACRSDYARDYENIVEFLEGRSSKGTASRALRPLLEGYLRRRFPMHMGGNDLLMDMVRKIESAPSGSPLAAASREADRLKALNTNVRDAHHGDRPDQGSGLGLSEAELRSDCREVLDIVHGWGTPS